MENTVLFEPLRIGTHTVRNRIVVPPMVYFGSTGEDGRVNDRHIRHYSSFARGGAGLVFTEACAVVHKEGGRNAIALWDDSFIPGLAELAESIHAWESKTIVQMLVPGKETITGAVDADAFRSVQEAFRDAAVRIQKAGFDGAELHAAHGYYLNQVSEECMRQENAGNIAQGMCLVTDIVKMIREACGSSFIISVRLGNPDTEALIKEAQLFEAAGADLLNISTGTAPYAFAQETPDGRIQAAGLVKKHVSVPVIAVGGIETGGQALAVIENGYADLVAVGHGHLCDPGWADKVCYGSEPERCLHCAQCAWYTDGTKCPRRMKRTNAARVSRYMRTDNAR